ncbi:hypothetical protein [Aquabacterium sp.]|uniref:hypothetical protein n=1 Tax=Aquabacterium sp. TaxID=1872578 RepID=UPI003D6C8AFA
MPYVLRSTDGQILSLHREAEEVAEFLPPDDPQVRAFLRGDGDGEGAPAQQFASLDADLVRVLEDLIDALIQRNILMVTDLPVQAQQKLFDRKSFRSNLKNYSLRLFDADPDASRPIEVVPTDFDNSL